MRKDLYYCQYLDRGYRDIVSLVTKHPARLFQDATDTAVDQTRTIAVRLSVPFGHGDVGRDVIVELGPPRQDRWGCRVPISWRASDHAALFPAMSGSLDFTPLDEGSWPVTEVSLVGDYRPPLGPLGAAGDALVGHRLAGVSVQRFVTAVVDHLARAIAAPLESIPVDS